MGKREKSAGDSNHVTPNFEESLESLEKIVRELEDGRLGLGESLAQYEAGVKHLQECYRQLEAAERKIELLTGVDAEGNPVTVPFEEREMSLTEKAANRSRRRSRAEAAPAGEEEDEVNDVEEVDTPQGLF